MPDRTDDLLRGAVRELIAASPPPPPFPLTAEHPASSRSPRRAILFVGAVVVVVGLVSFLIPRRSGSKVDVGGQGLSSRCTAAPVAFAKVLEGGVTQHSGKELIHLWAVQSADPAFEVLFFVSGEVAGTSGPLSARVATWAVPSGLSTVTFGPYTAGTPAAAVVNEQVARAHADPLVVPRLALIYSVNAPANQTSPWRGVSEASPVISMQTDGAAVSQSCVTASTAK